MGLQLPSRVPTEVLKKGAVRATARGPRRGISRVGAAQGVLDRGVASYVRSRAYDDRIPQKYAVSDVAGNIKGKNATHLARVYAD